ncbi:hypothetical protein CHS0354_009023 [Potamilus streckersoni]|uniref:Ras-related protein Rab-43 n=1 Tax=Potamilus streckersoni TaxID=2493646 RepID=A0AAE0TJ49_9BIVA|nr:hypothetical protein CHS0354_009023 [Potamilus streckersoni]
MAFHPNPDADESFDYLFKIVLIGDADVGKTCVVQRFKSGTYVEKHASTIGVDFTMKTLQIDGKLVKIWDTAGQERFRTITQSYYRSANGVVMAYDITKKSSFDNVGQWLDDVKRYAGPNIVQVLIGNKRDLEDMREVPFTEAKSYAQHHGMVDVLETSARENINIDEVFLKLAKELIKRYGGEVDVGGGTSGNIRLNSRSVSSGWGCCGS